MKRFTPILNYLNNGRNSFISNTIVPFTPLPCHLPGKGKLSRTWYREMLTVIRYILILVPLSLCQVQCSDRSSVDNLSYEEVYSLENSQLSPEKVQAFYSSFESYSFSRAALVYHRDTLLTSWYHPSVSSQTPLNVKSISKSVVSMLTGLALSTSAIDSLSVPVFDSVPSLLPPTSDSLLSKVTIQHLLTMRMGTQPELEDNYQTYTQIITSENWISTFLQQPLVHTPGTTFGYDTFQTHLLGVFLQETTRNSLLTLANLLFTPFQQVIPGWEQDPQGFYFGGNSMKLTAEQVGYLGNLMLSYGRWKEQSVLDSLWIETMLATSHTFDTSFQIGALSHVEYAHLWWKGRLGDYNLSIAYGYAGQLLLIDRKRSLIVVLLTNPDVTPEQAYVQETTLFNLLNATLFQKDE